MSKESQKTQRLQPVFDFESISKDQKSAERFVRLNFGTQRARLGAALDRMASAVSSTRSR